MSWNFPLLLTENVYMINVPPNIVFCSTIYCDNSNCPMPCKSSMARVVLGSNPKFCTLQLAERKSRTQSTYFCVVSLNLARGREREFRHNGDGIDYHRQPQQRPQHSQRVTRRCWQPPLPRGGATNGLPHGGERASRGSGEEEKKTCRLFCHLSVEPRWLFRAFAVQI